MASVGDILREKRIEQHRSIEQVANAIKIRVNILHAIENNELDVLPPPYVKSFVKTYARLLGLSDREEIKGFIASQVQTPKTFRTTPPTSETAPAPKPVVVTRAKNEDYQPPVSAQDNPLSAIDSQPRSNTQVNIIVSIGLVLGALALLYYFVFDNSGETQVAEQYPPPTQPIEVGTSEPATVETAIPSVDSAAVEAVAEQDSLILEARATDRVWISIVADGKRSSQMTLEVDNTYRWSADSIFTLSLGNAGGVRFTLNGKPLKQMGKTGAIVRNIRITRNGVISSSSPYTSSVTARSTAKPRPSTATPQRRTPVSITPVETKAPPPSIPPAEKHTPIKD